MAPSASAPSRCSVGTARITSREIEMMNGMIITVSTTPAARIADAVERSLKTEGSIPNARPGSPARRRPEAGTRTKIRQQSEDHAGDGRQQLDKKVSPFGNLGGGELRQKDRRAQRPAGSPSASARADVTTVP